MIDEHRLINWKELAAKATPGPWTRTGGSPPAVITNAPYPTLNPDRKFLDNDGNLMGEFLGVCHGNTAGKNREEEWRDLEFIAASRTIVPELIAEIEASRLVQTTDDKLGKMTSTLFALDYVDSVEIRKEKGRKPDSNPIYKAVVYFDNYKKGIQLPFTKMDLEEGIFFTDYIIQRFIDAIKFELDGGVIK